MSSAMIKPAAQMSTPVPYFFEPKSNSGDRYQLEVEEFIDWFSCRKLLFTVSLLHGTLLVTVSQKI